MPDAVLDPIVPKHADKPLRRMLSYAWHSPGRIAVVVILSFLGTFLAIVPAVLVGNIINGPITDGDRSALASSLLTLLLIALAGFAAMWAGGRLLAVEAQGAMYRLRKEVFEHTQTLSLRFFDKQPIGDLMSRITNDLDAVTQFFDKGLYPAINSAFTLLSTTVLIGSRFKPFYATERGTDLGVKTWPPDQWRMGGGTVWGFVSYDPALDLMRRR